MMRTNKVRQRRKFMRFAPPEVSLTPLIDTALTLLIIFMVTTPMIHNAIKVDLPKEKVNLAHGKAQEGGTEPQELVVSVDEKGIVFVNNMLVELDSLGKTVSEVLAQAKSDGEKSVWVRIDKANSCNMLIGVIDRLKLIDGVKDVKVATTQKQAVQAA